MLKEMIQSGKAIILDFPLLLLGINFFYYILAENYVNSTSNPFKMEFTSGEGKNCQFLASLCSR